MAAPWLAELADIPMMSTDEDTYISVPEIIEFLEGKGYELERTAIPRTLARYREKGELYSKGVKTGLRWRRRDLVSLGQKQSEK